MAKLVDQWLTALISIERQVRRYGFRCFKSIQRPKMPGRMGGNTVTVQNLEVVQVDTENNVI